MQQIFLMRDSAAPTDNWSLYVAYEAHVVVVFLLCVISWTKTWMTSQYALNWKQSRSWGWCFTLEEREEAENRNTYMSTLYSQGSGKEQE